MRTRHTNLRGAVPLVLFDDAHELKTQVRERPQEGRGVLPDGFTTAQGLGVHRIVRDSVGCVDVGGGIDVVRVDALGELSSCVVEVPHVAPPPLWLRDEATPGS